ncbi:alpha/beta-hydrolase [Piromyces finnis]|uniref:Alpha/beta-hydrolase n=1 Tax=Piromyces finnis TaxID=1754191 RepID=A0A1Y1UWW8_9FUNG|nr:alpha/beta-hydrolase [Piromyces finnis]|eukprot:ORX42001.1 alpha/beta-hydrolase [Piromyces finnis]
MKLSINLFIFFILIFILYINAGFIISSIVAYKDNLINLIFEKNVATDIKIPGSSSAKADVYYDKKDTKTLKPVVIFVHGGAWIFGSKYQYSRMGSLLVEENYVGVLPEYVLFPKGTIDDMVNDIYNSIVWTYNNIQKYGGNKDKIILSGHSAGAHLTALTVFKSALRMKNQNDYMMELPKLEKMVLLNGPYDFDDYDISKLFVDMDIEHGMTERFISYIVDSKDVSPTDILKTAKDNSISDFGMPEIVVYYAGEDKLIPESSADNLLKQIRRVSPNTTLKSVYKENNTHFTVALGIRLNDKEQDQFFMELINM